MKIRIFTEITINDFQTSPEISSFRNKVITVILKQCGLPEAILEPTEMPLLLQSLSSHSKATAQDRVAKEDPRALT